MSMRVPDVGETRRESQWTEYGQKTDNNEERNDVILCYTHDVYGYSRLQLRGQASSTAESIEIIHNCSIICGHRAAR